jgi:hypothetical protein
MAVVADRYGAAANVLKDGLAASELYMSRSIPSDAVDENQAITFWNLLPA